MSFREIRRAKLITFKDVDKVYRAAIRGDDRRGEGDNTIIWECLHGGFLNNILNADVSILNNQDVHIVAFYMGALVWLSLFHMVIGSALSLLDISYELDIQKSRSAELDIFSTLKPTSKRNNQTGSRADVTTSFSAAFSVCLTNGILNRTCISQNVPSVSDVFCVLFVSEHAIDQSA